MGLGFAASLIGAPAFAQGWTPTRTVRIVVPASGGTVDLVARLVTPRLQEMWGQAVIVESRPGASGNIAAALVAKAPGDGHTLLVGFNPLVISTFLSKNLQYDIKELAPVTLGVTSEQVLVVNPDLPVNTLAEFVALAKKSDSLLNYGSIGIGSASHLTMELFKSRAGINVKHIPYKGAGPALTDLLGKQTSAGVFASANVIPFVKDGKLKALAITGGKRLKSLPGVPSMAEAGFPNFEAPVWIGFLAPATTPAPIIRKIQEDIAKALRAPSAQGSIDAAEFNIVANTPEEFGRFLQSEATTWARMAQQADVKPE
jgi:tripartite-type tricarboxylate transporter receptor subunit TctC